MINLVRVKAKGGFKGAKKQGSNRQMDQPLRKDVSL